MSQAVELRTDPKRLSLPGTGIFIRAIGADGKWGPQDAAHLDRASLLSWLRSRDDMTPDNGRSWREQVLLIVLGHEDES